MIALFFVNHHVRHYSVEITDAGSCKDYKPHTVAPKTLLKMSTEMEKYVFGVESTRYLREVRILMWLFGFKC